MTEEESIICQNCKNKLAREAIICPKCGTYVLSEKNSRKEKSFFSKLFGFGKKNKA